jgi:4,5-DOPA dioxygenase extradiol
MRYAAPGDPELGRRILDLLPGARGEEKRGFDHGVWSPLILMYPDASIPVVEVSVQRRQSAALHYGVGQALAPLREEGILILGSGSATHNLREIGRGGPHVTEFEDWLCDAITDGRAEDLIRWEELAPHARRNHPTPEHLLPLFAPLGAANGEPGEVLNRVFEYASLSMAAFTWR